MYRGAKVTIVGGIENMAGFRCPHCGEPVDVFPRVGEDRSIWAVGIERLGQIPLDPEIGAAGDSGVPLLVGHPESPQAAAFRSVAAALLERL